VFFDVWVGLNANRVISDNDAVKEDIDSYLQALNDIKSFMESKDMAEPIVSVHSLLQSFDNGNFAEMP